MFIATHLPYVTVRLLLHPAGPDGQPLPSKYDLIANIVHEGKAGQQTSGAPYKVHIHRGVEKTWYDVQVRAAPVRLVSSIERRGT